MIAKYTKQAGLVRELRKIVDLTDYKALEIIKNNIDDKGIQEQMEKFMEIINLKIKCEICHKNIALKTKISLSGKRVRMCSKCYKIVKF
ncbi:hypothetical protein [Clostridium beijerinckii]|uniref:Uncharacterized protein n=1 Tax=Clostridium beijerinckii TaxID=1520 RepID=A0A9Q5CR13_CLOBE|nr:hypothetical protein [Clostridium beijerinckii]AQS05952.1 hypothetical protein CLBIJ_33950 [Clostridium beijerinckii]MBA2888140.1 hypothetical protein [Clostridium beijerinckii]MBA2902840.1 hypothetical protein [Clostridium beijerinckii]MBA2912666.1 hypothetical protein [Clostridium beijerinckii]MBA9014445.1 hypothetical protein [Clostridium beijerinckii]